jgi:hypothetical protein
MKHRLTALALVCLALGYGRQAPPLSAVEAPVFEIDDLGSVGGNFTLPSDINDVGDASARHRRPPSITTRFCTPTTLASAILERSPAPVGARRSALIIGGT